MQYALAYQLGERSGGLDPDAKAYIAAVEAADAQTLESGVKKAINNFVVGCKADGIWDAIKASCILAGARTLSGALVPLKGTAPTNFNFVSGDYNRETGLKGNGSTKYLDSNRANNADPQDSKHLSVFFGAALPSSASNRVHIGVAAGITTTGSSVISTDPTTNFARRRINGATAATIGSNAGLSAGFHGGNRSVSSEIISRQSGSNTTTASTSETPQSINYFVFARNDNPSSTTGYSNARLAFYSIGESLDLADLDARVSTLVAQITLGIRGSDFDTDAAAYITSLRTAGSDVTTTQVSALNTFYKAGKSQGWYSSLKRMYLPIWGAASPNAIDMIALGSGTFSGTVTHASGYVQGDGSTGYFDFGVSPSTLGLTNSSGLVGSLMKTADTTTSFTFPIGARSASNSGQISSHQNASATSAIGWIGRTSAAGTTESAALTVSAVNAILLSNRNSSGLKTIQRLSTGLIESSANALEATDAITNQNIYGLAINSVGSASGYTDSEIGALYAGLGLSDGNVSAFTLALKDLWETSTGLTLP